MNLIKPKVGRRGPLKAGGRRSLKIFLQVFSLPFLALVLPCCFSSLSLSTESLGQARLVCGPLTSVRVSTVYFKKSFSVDRLKFSIFIQAHFSIYTFQCFSFFLRGYTEIEHFHALSISEITA